MAYQRKAGNKRTIWRINHRPEDFSEEELSLFMEERVIVVKNSLADELKAIRQTDYFYLHYGNQNHCIKLLGKIIDDTLEICPIKDGYFQRHYEILCAASDKDSRGKQYGDHLPMSSKIIYEVNESLRLEKDILKPFFDRRINNLKGLWTEETTPTRNILSPPPIFPLNQIFHGVPGTGKTYSTTLYAVAICENKKLENENYANIKRKYDELRTDGRIFFTTFHQSYGYEDFIEGIAPTVDNGNIYYKIRDGVFKKFCDAAKMAPNKNFVFIIDEINRGNISKIFGELITLIEDDKREEISVTLPTSQESFTVPRNVYIIGTMNTADRSIALIDTALRRRFNFIEMTPRPELLSSDVDGVNLQKLLATLNTRIEANYDREHAIGHGYFIKCKTLADIKAVFLNKIIPLLQEYFFEDYALIQKILGEKFIGFTPYRINQAAFDDAENYKL